MMTSTESMAQVDRKHHPDQHLEQHLEQQPEYSQGPDPTSPNVHLLWAIMVALTLATYAVGLMGYSGVYAVMALLIIAAIKSTIVIRDFMGLRGVSFLWRAIMYGWLSIVIFTIGVIYLFSL